MGERFSLWWKCPRGCDLSAYADGELSEPARERIAAHLKECLSCRHELDSLAALSREVRPAVQEISQAVTLPPTPTQPWREAHAVIDSRRTERSVDVLVRRAADVAAAACLLLTVVWLLWRTPVGQKPEREIVGPQPQQEPTAEAATMRQDDPPAEVAVGAPEPLRADVLALARAGDPEARGRIGALGLNGKLLARAPTGPRESVGPVHVSDMLLEHEAKALWSWRFTGERQ